MTAQPYHVLITRLSAIGDCILTMPLATAIKRAMPAARVSWCVSCAGRQLLEICPDVDHVIPVSRRWLREPSQWKQLRQTFRDAPIDCVIDPQSLTKSAMLGRLSKAPTRIGFTPPRGREMAPWLNTINVETTEDQHLVDAQMQLLEPLGIQPSAAEFRLDVPDETTAWAESEVMKIAGCASPMIINPGAGWDSRLWPTDRFGKVAAWVKQEFGIPTLVVWGGDREHQFAQEICAASGGAAVMGPDTRLVALAAILRTARLFIAGDTGPTHLAVAVGTRVLSLHGPTQPHRSGPYGDRHESIQKAFQDGSSRRRRTATNEAMCQITVDDVCERLSKMMNENAQAAA